MAMYFQSVVIPVKTGNKQAFLDMANKMSSIFAEHGAMRSVECWGDDLMDGKVTDFKRAVQATDDETVVFSWDWWPDKATYDAAMKKLMADDRMKPDGSMPFDGRRLIYGAFETSSTPAAAAGSATLTAWSPASRTAVARSSSTTRPGWPGCSRRKVRGVW